MVNIHYKKNQYYLLIFIKDLGPYVNLALSTDITYEQHYLWTLPTDSESVGKFSITYQLLSTDLNTYQLLPTDLYYLPTITHESLLPTNYHPRISITYQLLS